VFPVTSVHNVKGLNVLEEQRQDCKLDAHCEPAIYCGSSMMDNRSSYVLYMSNSFCSTFVTSNNVVFGNKCQMAKDAPNVIDNEEVAPDFPLEANISEITILRLIEQYFYLGSNSRHSLYFADEQ
jgi:hypothetical protein